MTVAKHISRLLYSHDCVIVPELGGFVTNNKGAQLDVDKNIFLPPSKEIGFNRSLIHNDGLLVTYIAQQENLSYREAKVEVAQFANHVLKQVANGQTIVIDSLGELKQDSLGNLVFFPGKSENFLPDAFGLTSFHFAPVVPVHRPQPVNKNVKRLLRPITKKQIAASIAIIFGLFIVSTKVNDSSVEKQLNTANAVSFLTSEPKSETNAHPVRVVNKEEIEASMQPEIETTIATAPKEKDIYFLIAGSFKKQSQAETFLGEVQKKGEANAFVLQSNINNSYRVAIQGFSNKTEAIASLNNYRKKTDFSTVWILTQR